MATTVKIPRIADDRWEQRLMKRRRKARGEPLDGIPRKDAEPEKQPKPKKP
jgi:hypothetical protein